MIGSTAVVVDSTSYLPPAVHERYGLLTVPLAVVIDGDEFREFETIDAPAFYRRLMAGAKVSTSQPSPGAFLSAYERAHALGAEQVVSIHIGAAISGTVNAARVAAEMAPLPVHVIDTGQASFIEGLCAWEACEALAAGAPLPAVEEVVHRAAASAGNIFLVRGLELLRAGGRLRSGDEPPPAVPILALEDGAVRPIASADTVEAALEAIISRLAAAIAAHPGKQFRIGVANGAADELAAHLEARVRALPGATEVMQYVIGPVIGAHTGPGCTGVVFLPRLV